MSDTDIAKAIKTVQDYFESMEQHDEAKCASLFTEDVTETIPFNRSGLAEPQAFFNGKREVLGYVRQIFANFRQTRMRNKVYTASADGSTVFCEAQGDLVAAKDSKPYLNLYVFRFTLRDGLIGEIREYANPVTYSQLMGLPVG